MTKLFAVSAFLMLLSFYSKAQTPARADINENYKWNLSDIYSSNENWKTDVEKFSADVDKLPEFRGKLSLNSVNLYRALKNYFDLVKGYWKASTYAMNMSNENLSISEHQAMTQQMTSLGTKISENTAFLEPEIISIPEEKINRFLKEEPGLQEFEIYIDNIRRLREHTLSEPEEKILASFNLIARNQNDVFGIFNNSEFPYSKVKLSTGEEVELTPAAYTKYRTVTGRNDREMVMKTFFENYGRFRNTLGANLSGKVKKDWVYAKNRKYSSSLEASLNPDNLPVSIYSTLVEQINNNLPTLHRFLDLKKRMLGVDELHYYDLYVPLVEKLDIKYTVEEGQKIMIESLKLLGSDYTSVMQKSFSDRWIDYYPTSGKRSGAYSTGGAYDVHPYILMNWTDNYESVSTLAHELGHTMHSYLSNSSQPFAKADYPTFVAEIASTVNENLLNDYMVENAKTDEEKLFFLGSYLDLLRSTIFRQTSFAEFELEIHKKIEAGEPLTGDDMCEIYSNIVKKYYGHEQGYTVVDDYIMYEWSSVPHFVGYTYYVFQYATSLIYGTALVEKMKEGGEEAVEKYYNILKGGSSKYAVELIRDAGIDPMSPEPFELTMRRMNKVMDEIDELLKKMEKQPGKK